MKNEIKTIDARVFLVILLLILLIASLFTGCSRPPQTVERVEEKTVTCYDTATVYAKDSVPCNDFTDTVFSFADTLYIESHDKVLSVQYKTRHDTVYKYINPTVINPAPRRIKVDNSTHTTSNNGIPWYWNILIIIICVIVGRLSKLFIGRNSII